MNDATLLERIVAGDPKAMTRGLDSLLKARLHSYFNLDMVSALADSAPHIARQANIRRLGAIVGDIASFVDIRVKDAYFHLMRSLFIHLPRFEDGMDAVVGLFQDQGNTFDVPDINVRRVMSEQFELCQKEMVELYEAVEERRQLDYAASTMDNLCLYSMWLCGRRACTELVQRALASKDVFEAFEPLFCEERSPLLKLKVKFAEENDKQIILTGLLRKQLNAVDGPYNQLSKIDSSVFTILLQVVGKIDDLAAAQLYDLYITKVGELPS